MPSSRKKHHFNPPPANGLPSQSTQQPRPVCTWSSHVPQSGPLPLPFPRYSHALTASATAAGELFLYGGCLPSGFPGGDLYAFSTRDFSITPLQTIGEVPGPRSAHGAALISTTLLICGGETDIEQNVLNHHPLFLLNLGTSDLFTITSSPTPADHNFALQYREGGPALWSMVLDQAVVASIP